MSVARGRLTGDSSPESWSSVPAGGEIIRDLVSTHVSMKLIVYAILRCAW
jgi:hypothetical protein